MQYAAAVGTAPGVRVALIELALQLKLAPLRVSSENQLALEKDGEALQLPVIEEL